MEDSEHITGLSDLQKFLDQLAPKVEANIMRGALRAGMAVVKPVAQANVHSVSGELAAGLTISTRRRGHVVSANLKAGGRHASIAHLVEFGTQAHFIQVKESKWLTFGGIFVKSVSHPGARPHPFMRPALDSQASAAVVATGEYIKNRLATKEGLDTSHIMIEGDDA